MSNVSKNLAALLEIHDLNPTELADRTKVPQPTIHRILAGDSEDPRTSTLRPLADYFGIPLNALREGDMTIESFTHEEQRDLVRAVHERFATSYESASALRPFKNVPVVGSVEAGPDGYLEEAGYPVGHGDGSVEHPAKGHNAYALRVRGESMHPRIRSGEFIVVEPDIPANPGDDVVVICCDGRKMVKQMLYQRDGEVTLGSINNGFKPITLPLQEVEAIHYVAGILPRGAFKL